MAVFLFFSVGLFAFMLGLLMVALTVKHHWFSPALKAQSSVNSKEQLIDSSSEASGN